MTENTERGLCNDPFVIGIWGTLLLTAGALAGLGAAQPTPLRAFFPLAASAIIGSGGLAIAYDSFARRGEE